MATMDDIARNLGVSKSTVSKALSGAEDVSATMRRAVLEKAVELGYSKVSRHSEAPRIAIFITNMAYRKPDDFGFDIVMGFRKAAEPAGFHVEIIPLDILMQQKIRYDEFMVLENFRGGLFLGLSLRDPWLKDFETCRTPAVLYDNHVKGNANVTYMGVDNVEGMDMAVEHLISLGHKKSAISAAVLSPIFLRSAAMRSSMFWNGTISLPARNCWAIITIVIFA